VTDIQDRYQVYSLTRDTFVIRDLALRAFCALNGRVLKWKDGDAADGWLRFCYSRWGVNPNIDEDPPPQSEWRRVKRQRLYDPNRSPWEQYLTPPSDSMYG
jgi:hypothetical protein